MVNGDKSDRKIVMKAKSKPRSVTINFWIKNKIKFYTNLSAWMNWEIFKELILDFDNEITEPAILILDYFSGHRIDCANMLKNLTLLYLPPNTTAKTQPLDAGIIFDFKMKFRKKMLHYVFKNSKNENFRMNMINLKFVAPWIREALDEIQVISITKCFWNTLSVNVAETGTGTSAINDTEEIFKNELSSLYESIEKFISTEIPIEGVLSYAYLSEEEWDVTCNIAPEMANLEETIEIPDQKLVMKHLKTVLEYFKGIYCN